ncbi:DUF3866 family protein [Brachybacterium sp. EF45031]|uniref:DUF3866 family protein n=1 Tax=Brachybacterium sillae TaxID=2810536 RepID=UPI00217F1065|nr:DUF3866 family protein [Brachybacterium sillae]MCS6710667.1 DUF3866 family protein [Brachybacterium sillae]
MVRWERGTVRRVLERRRGIVRVEVEMAAAKTPPPEPPVAEEDIPAAELERVSALAYTDLVGEPAEGEVVLLNTNALRRGLGTGGDALVVARPDADPEPPTAAGHLVKARYSPLQVMVDAVDEPGTDAHEVLTRQESLEGMPVVVADLHSALPAVVAGILATSPGARIVHLHTDAAALPGAYSRTAAQLRDAGLMAATVTVGQSFGGDAEAVTIHSGLLAARHVLRADVVVAVQGPGNLGSGTPWGFSGMQAAECLHAAAALGGRSIAALRVSQADPRERHRGLSHHSATVLGRAVFCPVDIPLPTAGAGSVSGDAAERPQSRDTSGPRPGNAVFRALIREQVNSAVVAVAAGRGVDHRVHDVGDDGLLAALEALPVRLSTMGRGLAQEPESFVTAAAAGRFAARHLVPSGAATIA